MKYGVTTTVFGDEKAIGLYEMNELAPKLGWCRYQIIRVLRNGKIAEYRENMGPTSLFKGVNQINIPSLLEHTVDELKDLATELRAGPVIDVKEIFQLNNYKPA